MTQAICDITIEPQADTMVEVANRAGGMEQVFHDNTLIGNGNSVDLGVNTDIIATKEYSDEQDTLLRNEIQNELQTQLNTQATAISGKQDQLIAGDNIFISGNIISATGAGGGAGFDIVVVQELPATGQKGIIYLLAKDGAAPDVYDEYVWITATQTFELIGSTKVDLSGYLPLTGGEMTGLLTLNATEKPDFSYYTVPLLRVKAETADSTVKLDKTIKISPTSTLSLGGLAVSGVYGISPNSTKSYTLGSSSAVWSAVYATKLNNGANISIPTTGGTLALAEDIAKSVTTTDLTVGTDEGTLNIGITAGVATIATNNGLDIISQTKFDTLPTTDDTTTWANALDANLVSKAQVASALNSKADTDLGNITSTGKETVVGWGMPDTNADVNIGANYTYTFPTNGWLMLTANVASSVQYTSDKYTADQYSPFHYGCLCPAGSAFAGMYPVQSGETITKTFASGQWKALFYPNKGV